MTISERLFSLLDSKGLKYTELAESLGINKSVISTWKARNSNPPIEYAVRISEFLGVPLEYFLTGTVVSPGAVVGLGLELSEAEIDLIMDFRQLNESDQDDISTEVKRRRDRTFTVSLTAASSTLKNGSATMTETNAEVTA